MKKKLLIFNFIEFFLIFLLFVLPSLLVEPQKVVVLNIQYDPFSIILRLCVAMYLLFRMYDNGISFKQQLSITPKSVFRVFIQSIKIYFALVITGLLFNFIQNHFFQGNLSLVASPPSTVLLWIWFLFSLIVLACFEEIIFRIYLPDSFLRIVTQTPIYKKLPIPARVLFILLIECFFIITFALGHYYLGTVSLLASFVSGIILRISVLRYKTIIPACIAHIINNIVSFLVLFYVR